MSDGRPLWMVNDITEHVPNTLDINTMGKYIQRTDTVQLVSVLLLSDSSITTSFNQHCSQRTISTPRLLVNRTTQL